MKTYVLCYAMNWRGEVAVVHKDRPDWQKGKLNLPGGKIEPGETPVKAAARELFEETGLHPKLLAGDNMGPAAWQVGQIYRPGEALTHIVYFHGHHGMLMPRPGETERPEWFKLGPLLRDPRLIHSLRVVLPYCLAGLSGWQVTFHEEEGHTIYQTTFDIEPERG